MLGSKAATWQLRFKPTGVAAGTTSGATWDFGELRRWIPSVALLVCERSDDASAPPWVAIVHVQAQTIPLLGGDGKGSASAPSAVPQATRRNKHVTDLFGLPASEVVLETIPCLLVRTGRRHIGKIHLTQGYLCLDHQGQRTALAWPDVRNPTDSLLHDEVTFRLREGLRMTQNAGSLRETITREDEEEAFGLIFFQSEVPHDVALQRIRQVRQHALQEMRSPAALWRPHDAAERAADPCQPPAHSDPALPPAAAKGGRGRRDVAKKQRRRATVANTQHERKQHLIHAEPEAPLSGAFVPRLHATPSVRVGRRRLV